MNVKVTSLGSL